MIKTSIAIPGPAGSPRRRSAWAAAGLPIVLLTVAPSPAEALDNNVDSDVITATVANGKADSRSVDNAEMPNSVRAGNYYFTPSVKATSTYDDNIFRTRDNKEADMRFELLPVVTVRSDLPRHILDFEVGAKLIQYLENTDQNYNDVHARVTGGLHFDHAHTLSLSMLSEFRHEEKGLTLSPEDAAEPVPVFHNRAAAGITRDAGRLFGTVSISADRYDYSDVRSEGGGTLDQDYRDTNIFTAQLRAGYRIVPGFDIVAKLKALRQLNDPGADYVSTQSTGIEATAGLQFATSGLMSWHLMGGYGVRDFDEEGVESIDSYLVEGGFTWRPTQKATVKGSARREINAATVGDDYGAIETGLRLRFDYEIYHNLFANAGVQLSKTEFLSDDRIDDTAGFDVGLAYHLTPNWHLSAGYAYEQRQSTEPDAEMIDNRFTIGAKLTF